MQRGVLKGILWHQGEGDSSESESPQYENRLIELIKALRADLADKVPFVAATLGDFFVEGNPQGRVINETLLRIPRLVQGTACVDSSGLRDKGDSLHFNAASARELGRRYAEAMLRLKSQLKDPGAPRLRP
jgi:hypothetical protein